MSNKKKKRIIALLLALSSFISGWLLLSYEPSETKNLQNLSAADTLLRQNFDQFNIPDSQITQVHHQIDTGFVRKEYLVEVSPSFSQTQFHSQLNRSVYPYNIKTPARLDLGSQTMNIYLYYDNSIIRTIKLRMDPSLVQHQNPASILVFFDQPPNSSTLRQLIRIGEPVPLVFKVQKALRAKQLNDEYSSQYNHLAFWFVDYKGANLLSASASISDLQSIKRFSKLSPQNQVLSFFDPSLNNTAMRSFLSGLPLQYIPVHEALWYKRHEGQITFNQVLKRFEKMAKNDQHPILILSNGNDMLQRLHQAILEFKKRGLKIVPPPHRSF